MEAGLLLLCAPQTPLGVTQAALHLLQLAREVTIGALQLRRVLGNLLWKQEVRRLATLFQ